MGLVKRDKWLPPWQTEPVPGFSKTGSLLAKAEPISNAGGTSGIAGLRKSKIALADVVRERSEKMQAKQPCRHPGQ